MQAERIEELHEDHNRVTKFSILKAGRGEHKSRDRELINEQGKDRSS
jgi:hypothetical protein